MTNPQTVQPNEAALAALRHRCQQLGMPTWRSNTEGLIVSEPTEKGIAGLWLRSGFIARSVAMAAVGWKKQEDPGLTELFPGCWLIPIPEVYRRRRSGYTIAMVLGKEVLKAEQFDAACGNAQLDPQAARVAVSALAHFEKSTADQIATMLRWTLEDLGQLFESELTIDGFTQELTSCYESIDLFYGFGRSMNKLAHPSSVVRSICDRLFQTMNFGWLAIRFATDKSTAAQLAGQLITVGTPRQSPDSFARTTLDLLNRAKPDSPCFILNIVDPVTHEECQVLVQPIVCDGTLAGILTVGSKHGDDPHVNSYDTQLIEAAAGFIGAFLENATLYAEQQAMFLGTLQALTASIDAKDRYTCGHSERVAALAAQLARAAGMDDDTAERVWICGLVHDVGKIGVPESVLTKPGRLTDEEFDQIKMHPEIGHRILKDIPQMADILPGVLHHHERWDGNGYPHGVSGDEIPMFARLLCLADTFDAMSSTRSYRSAVSRPEVLKEIESCAGTQFDPNLTRVFLTLDLGHYDTMVAKHALEHSTDSNASQAA